MTQVKRGLKVSTKINLVFLLILLALTGIQTWLNTNTDQGMAFLLSIATTLVAFCLLWTYTHRLVARSLSKILDVVERWRAGEMTAQIKLHTRDEFQQLGDTFNQLSTELNHTMKGLEKTVAERTLILQRRARQLQAAADVGRVAVTIRNPEILLPEVARLISIRFDTYHVGIFMINESGEYAVLRASNSDGGKQMLQDHYQLKVGTQGLVGYVAREGEPRISSDVGTDTIHIKNPYLPDTRSEIALPLSVGGNILGVLDVQSTRPAAFADEDISILQIMADQVAIAIDNAHLLAENSKALEISRRAYGELSREVWARYLKSRTELGYMVDNDVPNVKPSPTTIFPEFSVAWRSGQVVQVDEFTITVPIKLREHVIGAFRLQKKVDAGEWTNEEIELMHSISDQVSVALEAARLFDDTQRRAERERLAGEITTKMRTSNDPQEILQIAVKELRSALQATKAQVTLTKTPVIEFSQEINDNGGGPD